MNSMFDLEEQLDILKKTKWQLVCELNDRLLCYIITVYDLENCLQPHAVSDKYMMMRKEIVTILKDWGAVAKNGKKMSVIFEKHRRRSKK